MSFNYASERNEFDAAWEKLRKEYADAGMPEENIELMYQFDLKQFNADRAYVNHTCPLNLSHEQMGENDDFENPFLEKFLDQFTTQYDTYGTHSRYWWLEELSDPRLVSALPMLTREDKEFIASHISGQYDTVQMTIINRTEGVVDKQNFKFSDIIGKYTRPGRDPLDYHMWEYQGKPEWYTPISLTDKARIADTVMNYAEMYLEQPMSMQGM